MTLLSDRAHDPRVRARLLVLAAFSRAHASRLLARLASLGRGPLPVPPAEISLSDDFTKALEFEAAGARAAASRYSSMATIARAEGDLSTAWVCELNRAEEDDRALELLRLAHGGADLFEQAPMAV